MSEFANPGEAVTPAGPGEGMSGAAAASDGSPEMVASDGASASAPDDQDTASPVAVAMRELDTIADRDLAEHPDVYQRIHTELQAALSTIDDA